MGDCEESTKEMADLGCHVGPVLQETKSYGISARSDIAEIEGRRSTGDARADRASRSGTTTIST